MMIMSLLQGPLWKITSILLLLHSASSLIQSPPKIIKQPPTDELLFQVKSRADESDKPFIIECEADGEPAPEYFWTKDGKAFDWILFNDRMTQRAGSGTLVIKSPREEDVGQYQCYAKNKWGTAITNSVFVRKSEMNNFKDEPPKTLTVQEGDPFGIGCDAPDGWPQPNILWMLEGQNSLKSVNSSRLTVDPAGKLWFSNVTYDDMSDNFLYACSAASYFRNEYKLGNRVHLHVIPSAPSYPPKIHEPVLQYVTNKNEVAYRGKDLKLWCIFGGTPLPTIKWTRIGQELPQDRIMHENYGKTLIIRHVDFEDEGLYQCEATNADGQTPKKHQIQVQVQAKPRFKIEPEIQNAAEDETAVFECIADGEPMPTIQWIHNGSPIEIGNKEQANRIVDLNRITIGNLQKQDTGNYGCNATNKIGYVYKDAYVNVLSLPPDIQSPPAKQSRTVEGQSVTINCQTFGAPKPSIKWYHGGLEISGERFQTSKEGNLIIKQTQRADAGIYKCQAKNKFGTESASGSLVVKEQTRILSGPKDYEAEAGSTATFRCHAEHDLSLPLRITWFKDGQYIHVNANNRFVQSSDHSLAITRTTEMDSGTYTCKAETDLDEDEFSAKLIVQDVPNAPNLRWAECNAKDATVVWQPTGENMAPIMAFIIQYSTSFNPDSWDTAADIVPPGDTTFKVSLSPWANYTFRVIARNKVGNSEPSNVWSLCTTPPDVPFKNPDNVEGRGTSPTNLVISWTPMRQIEHNAPGFHYKIYWKMDAPGENWNIEEIFDWQSSQLQVPDQPTYQRYMIKIVAHNDLGEANVAAEEFIGYSGEDVPTEPPTSLEVNEIIGPRSAVLSWKSVRPESVRGDFKGYKIQTWTEESGAEKFREIIMKSDTTSSLVQSFIPNSLNYARVLAFNGAFNGPASNTIKFHTPEGKPGPIDALDCYPMGSSALLLEWKPPQEINGILTGYRIYSQQVTEGSELGPIQERQPRIMKDTTGRAKLAGLKPHSKYRVTIKATTNAGEGMPYWTECDTNFEATEPPSKPKIRHTLMNAVNATGKARIKITWQPNIEANPGSHFYVEYKKTDDKETFYSTKEELNEDSIVVTNLEPDRLYDFRVVAVDGVFKTPSDTLAVYTYSKLPTPGPIDSGQIAHSGWFIGMLLAVIFLILVCIVVFLIKQNRGGKYSVQEREEQHGRRDPFDDGGFPEFTQPLHDRHLWSAQTSSDLKLPTESDSDSINDYAGGFVSGRFDEDGSFIGQYGTLQRRQHEEKLLQQQMQQQELGIKQGGTYV